MWKPKNKVTIKINKEYLNIKKKMLTRRNTGNVISYRLTHTLEAMAKLTSEDFSRIYYNCILVISKR